MNAQKIDWNDIPFVLAVCETGSLSGAARKLGVNHSTVFRRIESIESKLGVKLFERLTHGYEMTTAGQHFFQKGASLESEITNIHRELSGHNFKLEGPLTVTTTDSLIHCLSGFFKEFQECYPDIELKVLSGTRSLDLMQLDADIALRPTSTPPETWIGKSLSSISYAVYAHKNYVNGTKGIPYESLRWIMLIDALNKSPMNQVTKQFISAKTSITTSSALMGVFDLVKVGLGVAVLPSYLGKNCTELVEIEKADDKYNTELWLLAHPDLRKNAKVHTFFQYATQELLRK